MSFSVSNNTSTTELNLVNGVTTTLTLKPETNLRFIVEDSCLGDTVSQNFFDSSQQTLTLIHGNGYFTNNFKGLNCGTIQATVRLSIENGQISCNVDTTKTFNKSFINARIEGNIVFDVTQTPCYISVTPSNAPIKIERDGQAFGNNTAFSPNDEIVISLDQEDLSADTRVLSIKVNNNTYTSFPITHTVTGPVAITVEMESYHWKTLFESSMTLSHGGYMNIPNLKANTKTRFTTAQGTITYQMIDGCENDLGTGNFTINARDAVVSDTGVLVGNGKKDNYVTFGFALTAGNGTLSFNAHVDGYDNWYNYYYLVGASLPILKVEQYVENDT